MSPISKSRTKLSRKREKRSSVKNRVALKSLIFPLLIVGGAWVAAFLMLLGLKPFYSYKLLIGQRAPSTVVAMVNFECVDLALTELDRKRADTMVLPVFSVDYSGYESMIQTLESIYGKCADIGKRAEADSGAADAITTQIEVLLKNANISLEVDELLAMMKASEDPAAILNEIKKSAKATWSQGIASAKEKHQRFQGVANIGGIIVESDSGNTLKVSVKKLQEPYEAARRVVDQVMNVSDGKVSMHSIYALIAPMMTPNLRYNPERTDSERSAASKSVPAHLRNVHKGETLVSIGERVTDQVEELLREHEKCLNEISTTYSRISKRIGQGCILLSALIVCVGLFSIMRPQLSADVSALLMMLTLSILILLFARGLVYVAATTRLLSPSLLNSLLPLAVAVMVAGLLIDSSVAVILGIWVTCAVAVMFDSSFSVMMQGLAVTVVAVLAVRTVRKRAQLFRAGLLVGVILMFLLIATGILQNQPLNTVILHSSLGLANGVFCTLVTLMLVPLMEVLFGLTSDIRLLELSDMGHPLLRRLAVDAPGTYHHSLMVANLGQAAADEIGANSLLVRVCAYFHDIGKLSKPEFFSENIKGKSNPHDDLSPHMSMLVIHAHVKEGVTTAKRHKLPPPVLDGIQQHHGSGMMKYFYHRALKQAEEENSATNGKKTRFDGDHFHYDGPKPTTKEMAILSLADAVEAASRSLEKPNSSRITTLVNDIVQMKIDDGQLDECALTLAELNAIKRSFIFSLTNMLHARVAYPKDEENNEDRDNQSADIDADKKSAATQDAPVPDGKSCTPEQK